MKDYYVTLKQKSGSVKTYHVIAHDIFTAWQQAVSIFGGTVCD